MGDELAPVVRWELSRLAGSGVLTNDEVICEVEDVKLKERTGALVVTDLRILFVRTSLLRRKTHVQSIPLDGIQRVQSLADPVWETRWGALTISYHDSGQLQVLQLDRIRGGRVRADEIARTIERQRAELGESESPASAS